MYLGIKAELLKILPPTVILVEALTRLADAKTAQIQNKATIHYPPTGELK